MKRKIAVISSSVRDGRLSHRVALFLSELLRKRGDVEVDLVDLREYDFPLFHERLAYMKEPAADVLDFARRITEADGVLVVSPVYNASFPAALKNVVDLLFSEWSRKPVLVVSVTYGPNPGIQTVQQLQALFLKMGARVAAPTYTVLNAATDFAEDGTPADPQRLERYAEAPVREFMWLVGKSYEDRD